MIGTPLRVESDGRKSTDIWKDLLPVAIKAKKNPWALRESEAWDCKEIHSHLPTPPKKKKTAAMITSERMSTLKTEKTWKVWLGWISKKCNRANTEEKNMSRTFLLCSISQLLYQVCRSCFHYWHTQSDLLSLPPDRRTCNISWGCCNLGAEPIPPAIKWYSIFISYHHIMVWSYRGLTPAEIISGLQRLLPAFFFRERLQLDCTGLMFVESLRIVYVSRI